MFSRASRIVALVLALATVTLAGYVLLVVHERRETASAAHDAVDREAERVLARVQEVRAAQQAYVAVGQNEQVWTGKVSALLPQISEGLTILQQKARRPDARERAAAAATALASFTRADIRAREYLRDGQVLMASDVIFSEARDGLAAISDAIDELRQAEARAHAADLVDFDRQQLYTISAAAGVLLLIVVTLTPMRRAAPPTAVVQAAATSAAPLTADPLTAEERAILDRAIQLDDPISGAAATDAPAAAATPRSPASSAPALASPPSPGVSVGVSDSELAEVAALCTDLGRLADGARLNELLARAATLSHATGLILWVADRTGQVLHAVAAHGYDARVLARLGPIPRTAENATAAAFRAAHVHTVPGDSTRNGAVVAPLLGPDGCIGVLTAEMPAGDQQRAATRALVAIVAAQLATLVATLPAGEGPPAD